MKLMAAGVIANEAKRLIFFGSIVTTKTKADAQSFGFTQEEVDQYELMHATRHRAAALKKEIHEELPDMKADLKNARTK